LGASKYSRKVMEEETSGSFSSVTGAESRDLNSGSHSRGDHGGEIQKTWSPMYIKDKHDYDDLSGDRNVLFLLSVSSNKDSVVRYLELVYNAFLLSSSFPSLLPDVTIVFVLYLLIVLPCGPWTRIELLFEVHYVPKIHL
jgi:hypothetical protein